MYEEANYLIKRSPKNKNIKELKKMTRDQKIQQAFRLVEVIVGGFTSQENKPPSGLITRAWRELFKNCYEGVNAMLEEADKIDPPKAKVTIM